MFSETQAATVTAKSASLTDVSSAVASACDGDTVIVPEGTATWTSMLTITKGITLQGATTITGPSSNPRMTDKTVILDDIPRPNRAGPPAAKRSSPQKAQTQGPPRAAFGKASPLRRQAGAGISPKQGIVRVQLTPTQSFRLTGVTFRQGSLTTKAMGGGLRIEGTCPSVRVDHCRFDGLVSAPNMTVKGQIFGVIDHCIFDLNHKGGNIQPFQIYHDSWGGYSHGDGSWADGPNFGSDKFLFIEDNTFRKSEVWQGGGIDCYGGGRYIARYNTFFSCSVSSHGTETSGRFRGVRAVEVYNNLFDNTLFAQTAGQLRSGTLLEYNNTWTGLPVPHATPLSCFREFAPFGFWGGANGNNPLDSNDSHGLYLSGTATQAHGETETLQVSGAEWRPEQWVGYSVTNISQMVSNKGQQFHPSAYISENTNDVIMFVSNNEHQTGLTFKKGDHFEIYKLSIALDQPGRGKGDLLKDPNPVATSSWPNEQLEPIYAWGNVYKDSKNNSLQLDVTNLPKYPTIQENRDFYNQKTPFDGSAGVGVGRRSERPSSCTKGVGYWATDEKTLYVATGTNTWAVYYKPYIYPHPLVTGASHSEATQRDVGSSTRSKPQ